MPDALDDIAEGIAERYLTPYTARLKRTGLVPRTPKEVHDPVWGTIALSPLEVAIIDSPLVQRLRHLRQLGVAHWVYPGANHSRFEHTLGVLHQSQQLIAAINRSARANYGAEIISEEQQDVIRVAALLHDIGHPFFSHVSEYALMLDPRTFLGVQKSKTQVGEDTKLSEMLAARVVMSRQFRSLLSVVFEAHAKQDVRTKLWAPRVDQLVEQASKAILGQAISTEVPLLHEIISGPYDADKLDYMVRDSKAAGIPTIIDISRLLQKLTVRKIPVSELPRGIAKSVPGKTPACYMFGYTWSGLSVVDELLLARLILYAKIYRHSKVIALEAMTQVLVSALGKLVPISAVLKFIYHVCDDELLLSDQSSLTRLLGLKTKDLKEPDKAKAMAVASEVVRRLRDRELFVKAFAFHPSDRSVPSEEAKDPFATLARRLGDRRKTEELRAAVVSETRRVMELADPGYKSSFNYLHADELISIVRAKPPSQEELRRAYIFPSSGPPITFGESGIHKDAWSSSFMSAAPKGYLFCPREISPFVFIALEVAVAREFGVPIPDWMMEEARQAKDHIIDLKRRLRQDGYYSDKPRCIRPLSERLYMGDAVTTVDEFAERFAAVQESVSDSDVADAASPVSAIKSRAFEWLDQFETPDHIECALELLRRSKMMGRVEAVEAIRRFLKDNADFTTASVVSLSRGDESGQIIQYFAKDAGPSFHFFTSLREAVDAGRPDPILFVDDFCGSGGQLKNIIGSWFNDETLQKKDLNEQRRLALEPEKEFLRSHKVGFVFVGAWKAGLGEIERATKAVGVDARVFALIQDDELPFAFEASPPTDIAPENWSAFQEHCRNVGVRLLRETEKEWSETKFQERALGYGNRAMLVFFPYNAPTQTLTNMWAQCGAPGEPWVPLVRRRKK